LSKPTQFVGLTIFCEGYAMLWQYDLDQEQRTDPRFGTKNRSFLLNGQRRGLEQETQKKAPNKFILGQASEWI
jgi:hypothetical protein